MGSVFTKETVWEKIHDTNPSFGAALFAENNRHILLMHAHDETDEMLPRYYELFMFTTSWLAYSLSCFLF